MSVCSDKNNFPTSTGTEEKKRKRRSQYELLTTTGGSGGRSDGDKSGICWNFSSAPNPSGAEDDDPNKPSTIMGNRILDMNQISKNISKHTVCRMCSENEVNSAVLEKTKDHEKFIDFVENYELEFTRLLSVARKGTAMSTSKRKGIRQLHGEYKKQKENKKAAASTPEKNKVSQSAATKKKSSAAKVSPPNYLKVTEDTLGLATTVKCKCSADDKHSFFLHLPEKTSRATKDSRYESSTWYGINYRFVCGMHLLGGGGVEAMKLLGMVDLAWQGWEKRTFKLMEEKVGVAERSVCDLAVEEALQLEIKLTLETEGKSYEEWLALPDGEKDKQKPKLTVSYDMGWQQRSSGHKYASNSGHGFIIGGLSRKVVGMVVFSKLCSTCAQAEKVGGSPPTHECVKNFDGSSKSMEAEGIVQLVTEAFNTRNFIVHVIISDDDSTMRAHLKHPRLKKNNQPYADSRGRLPTEINEPSFLADPQHRVKVVAKAIFAILLLCKKDRCGCTKADALRIKTNWGYFLKQNRGEGLEKMIAMSQAPLEHMFDNHEHCDQQWCLKKRAAKEGKQYNDAEGEFRCKKAHKELYELLKRTLAQFQTEERLSESLHPFDTQMNEALNNSIAYLCPKNKTFSSTTSLRSRISCVIGSSILNFDDFWSRVFKKLELSMSPTFNAFITTVAQRDAYRREYYKKHEVKRARRFKNKASLQQQIYDDRLARKSGDYGAGIAILSNEKNLRMIQSRQRPKNLQQQASLPCLRRRRHAVAAQPSTKEQAIEIAPSERRSRVRRKVHWMLETSQREEQKKSTIVLLVFLRIPT